VSGKGLVDAPEWRKPDRPRVFLAPHEKCQGNRHFTLRFWEQVALELLRCGVEVTVNDPGSPFMAACRHPNFHRAFPMFRELFQELCSHSLVLGGNTGIGWAAGACGVPLVAAEKDLILSEYSFEKSGVESLVAVVREPDVRETVRIVLAAIGKPLTKLVWFPQWQCQNYTTGSSFGDKCPYCPYSFDKDHDRLIFEDIPTGSNRFGHVDDFTAFLRRNGESLGWHFELSGGEPLLYPNLPNVLGELPDWTWGMTSNSISTSAIRRVIDSCGGTLERCLSWTASYHPLSGRDDAFAQNMHLLRSAGVKHLSSTVVVADSTLPALGEAITFLRSLPVHRVQFHLDTHRTSCRSTEELVEAAEKAIGPFPWTAGQTPSNKMCNRHSHLLAVSPDGLLFECVTKCYQNLDPICKVNGDVVLAELTPRGVFEPKLIESRLLVHHD
jgi:hypothetical protein